MKLTARSTLIIAPAFLLALACGGDSGEDEADATSTATGSPAMSAAAGPPPVDGDTVTTPSGIQYIVIEAGDGPQAQAGQRVRVHYTGWLTDGTKFDSSLDGGEPFSFELGAGSVIRGWDEGVAMMAIGEKSRLIIPAELGYGERGAGRAIPPGATLIFDVELLGTE